MKLTKLNAEQLNKLKDLWVETNGLYEAVEAIIDLYEAEMRPKEAAPARWIPVTERLPTEADGLNGLLDPEEDGSVLVMAPDLGAIILFWANVSMRHAAWMPIPAFTPPAEPTPEEKAEAEFEVLFDQVSGRQGIALTMADPVHLIQRVAKAVFMAAKFPAGGDAK